MQAAASRRVVLAPTGAPALVAPDESVALSDGAIVETSILARLLGIKLLTIEGTVILFPAKPRGFVSAEPTARQSPVYVDAGVGPAKVRPSYSRAGQGLAEASRLLQESANLNTNTDPHHRS